MTSKGRVTVIVRLTAISGVAAILILALLVAQYVFSRFAEVSVTSHASHGRGETGRPVENARRAAAPGLADSLQGGATQRKGHSSVQSAESQTTLRTFLMSKQLLPGVEKALASLGINLDVGISDLGAKSDSRLLVMTQDHEGLVFDKKRALLNRYERYDDEEMPSGWTPANCFPRDKALQIVLRIAEDMDFQHEIENPDVLYKESLPPEWIIKKEGEYRGVPSGGWAEVRVSAYNGRITKIKHYPADIPEEFSDNIGEAKARQIAVGFLQKEIPAALTSGGVTDSSLRIVTPNNAWAAMKGGEATQFADKGRLAWVVRFGTPGSQAEPGVLCVFVDASTGEIVGGIY